MRFLGATYTFTRPQALQSSTGIHLSHTCHTPVTHMLHIRYTYVTDILHTCYTPVAHRLLYTDCLVHQDEHLNFPFLSLHALLLLKSAHGKCSHENLASGTDVSPIWYTV